MSMVGSVFNFAEWLKAKPDMSSLKKWRLDAWSCAMVAGIITLLLCVYMYRQTFQKPNNNLDLSEESEKSVIEKSYKYEGLKMSKTQYQEQMKHATKIELEKLMNSTEF